jgi:hypothetical protein
MAKNREGASMRTCLAWLLLLVIQSSPAQIREPPALMEVRLAPGGFDELCFELGAGQSMRYAFDADAPLDFNLHWHRGSELLFPLQIAAVARLGGSFRSPGKEAYCLMWTNRTRAAVPLRARIDRAE